MKRKKYLTFGWVALAVLMTPAALAHRGQLHELSTGAIRIDAANGREALEKALGDISSVLQSFQPAGAKISGKQVTINGPTGVPRVTFKATKEVLDLGLVSFDKSAVVRGDVTQRRNIVCKAPFDKEGYRIEMDLQKSDSLVSDNASKVFVDICVKELQGGAIEVRGWTRMVEGPDYGSIAGPAAKDLLKQQTAPLISALQKTTAKYAVKKTASLQLHEELLKDLKKLGGARDALACR